MKILYLVLPVLLFVGCVAQITCNPPYILVGGSCCLDRNGNMVCDFEDTTTAVVLGTTTTASTTTTTNPPGPSHRYAGYLESLVVSRAQVRVGEVVEVRATFINQGDSVLVAFKGKAESFGGTVALLQSPVYVPEGRNITVSAFFTPTEVGGYTISGRMYYEGAYTNEIATTLKVVK